MRIPPLLRPIPPLWTAPSDPAHADPLKRRSPADADLHVHVPAIKPAYRLPAVDRETGIATFRGDETSSAQPLPLPYASTPVNLSDGITRTSPGVGVAQPEQGPT